MSDKNAYESMRDDVRATVKNVVALVLFGVVLFVILVVIVVRVVIIILTQIVFFAAIIVLLSIVTYACFEIFYYKFFARATKSPRRYHRRLVRIQRSIAALAATRTVLEARIRQLSASDQQRATHELDSMREQEAALVARLRQTAKIDANWIQERLNVTRLNREAILRRISTMSDVELNERLSFLTREASPFQSRLLALKRDYAVEPDHLETWNGAQQPWVAYIRRGLSGVLRLAGREPCAPRRFSALLSDWATICLVILVVALSVAIVVGGFSVGLPA